MILATKNNFTHKFCRLKSQNMVENQEKIRIFVENNPSYGQNTDFGFWPYMYPQKSTIFGPKIDRYAKTSQLKCKSDKKFELSVKF